MRDWTVRTLPTPPDTAPGIGPMPLEVQKMLGIAPPAAAPLAPPGPRPCMHRCNDFPRLCFTLTVRCAMEKYLKIGERYVQWIALAHWACCTWGWWRIGMFCSRP